MYAKYKFSKREINLGAFVYIIAITISPLETIYKF